MTRQVVARILLAMLVGAACGEQHRPLDRYFHIRPEGAEEALGWVAHRFSSDSGAVCWAGGVFKVFFRDAPPWAPNTDEAMVFLDGGGACWNDLTCSQGGAVRESHLPYPSGILDLDVDGVQPALAALPTVFIPSCDGSLFAGDHDVDYLRAGRVRHHGLQNLSAGIMVLKARMPGLRRILLVGMSAGGYGALVALEVLHRAFPDAEVVTVVDSGPGVMNPLNPLLRRELTEAWRIDENIPEYCTNCDIHLTPLMAAAFARHPLLVRGGFISGHSDVVMEVFTGLSPVVYGGVVRDQVARVKHAHPGRVHAFLHGQQLHGALIRPEFHTLAIDGVTLEQWVLQAWRGDAQWTSRME
ncbi:MAG: pectin acetylesterase-family hydrolase [Myxococcota bacterium]